MKITSAFFTHTGIKGDNEDCLLPPLLLESTWWAAVADGVGGHAGGKVASNTAIESVRATIARDPQTGMRNLFSTVHERLKEIAGDDDVLEKMGTTLSVVRFDRKQAHVGHVGDTRIYHLRGKGIVDRTRDQTEVQRLILDRILSKAQARRYPRRSVLLSVLSPSRSYDLYEESFEIEPGDRIILLTDGVYEKVRRGEIRDVSVASPAAKDLSENLERVVSARDPVDDYSALVIDIADHEAGR